MIQVLRSQLGSSLQSVRRFLERPIRLQRGHLTLGAPAGGARSKARDAQRRRLRHMRRDLYELMEHHPSSRPLMRHLDLVEHTLRRSGLGAVEALPAQVIAKALTQMERLVWDWTPVGLAEMRSRLAVMVKNGAADAARDRTSDESLVFGVAAHADVTTDLGQDELAAFAEMERSWAGRVPSAVAAVNASTRR